MTSKEEWSIRKTQMEDDCKKLVDLAEVLRRRRTVVPEVWMTIVETANYLRETFGSSPLTPEDIALMVEFKGY
jgi:hypothetical protein